MEVIIDGVLYAPVADKPTDKSLLSALEIRFNSDAGKNITIRDYLYMLLNKLWIEEEGFNGKRPFGNSGWKIDLPTQLAKHGFINGKLVDAEYDEWEYNEGEAKVYVQALIMAVFYGLKV
jgi:hypothetical protein